MHQHQYDDMWSDPTFCEVMDRLDRMLPEIPFVGTDLTEWKLTVCGSLIRIPDLFHSPTDVNRGPDTNVIAEASPCLEDQTVFDQPQDPFFRVSVAYHSAEEREGKEVTAYIQDSSSVQRDAVCSVVGMESSNKELGNEKASVDVNDDEVGSEKTVTGEHEDESDAMSLASESSDASAGIAASASMECIVSAVVDAPASLAEDAFTCGVNGCTDIVSRTNKDVKIHFRDTPQHYGRVPNATKIYCPFSHCSMSGVTADRNRIAEHLCSDEHFKAAQICYACGATFKSGRLYSMTRHRDGEPQKNKFGSCRVCEGCKKDFPSGAARSKHESHCSSAKMTKAKRLRREKLEKKEERLNRIIMCGCALPPQRTKAPDESRGGVKNQKEVT